MVKLVYQPAHLIISPLFNLYMKQYPINVILMYQSMQKLSHAHLLRKYIIFLMNTPANITNLLKLC